MEAKLAFPDHVKNGFSPKTTSHRRRGLERPISKVALLSCGSANVFTETLAQSVRELWSFITLRSTIVAFAGLKGWVTGWVKVRHVHLEVQRRVNQQRTKGGRRALGGGILLMKNLFLEGV